MKCDFSFFSVFESGWKLSRTQDLPAGFPPSPKIRSSWLAGWTQVSFPPHSKRVCTVLLPNPTWENGESFSGVVAKTSRLFYTHAATEWSIEVVEYKVPRHYQLDVQEAETVSTANPNKCYKPLRDCWLSIHLLPCFIWKRTDGLLERETCPEVTIWPGLIVVCHAGCTAAENREGR